MKKLISLLKASFKGEFNIFKIKGLGKFNNIILIVLLIFSMIICYEYSVFLADPLYELNLTYIVIALFTFVTVILNIIDGVYKSQSIIFEVKDNNLLFSMPIKKSYILISRFLKILLWSYLFEFIVLIPCIFKYCMLVKPDSYFYLMTFIFFIVLPLLPLIISCIVGYVIKAISVKFKNKKIVQTIITLLFFLCIMFISMFMESLISNIVENAISLNNVISKIYLPIGLYVDLINKFELFKFVELIVLSILPFVVFVLLFSFNYDKIVNYSNESGVKGRKKFNVVKKSVINSLAWKEIKTYFGTPIYIINTIISPLLMIILSIFLVIKYDDVMSKIFALIPLSNINEIIPQLFIGIILILLSLSTITASSISLEGKKYSLLKSLPIRENDIFLSKLLLNDLIMIPSFLIGSIIFMIKFNIVNYNYLFMIIALFVLTHINGQMGLLINLTFPKMDFSSEIQVVKQSASVLVSMIVNFMFALLIIFSFYKLYNIVNINIITCIYIILFIVLSIILNRVLNKYGVKKFRSIN